MSARALEISSVSRRFGGLKAVDRVSFGVPRGEIMGLIGPNGSGKTTLLNVIMGRLAPTDGTISKDGKRISGRTPEQICRLGLSSTFQLVRVPDALNARDNVAVAAMYGKRRLGVSASRAEAERLLERVQFEGNLEAHADQLTYFDQKRIELARALACAPEVLLLDEWLAGLNPSELERGIELIQSLRGEGITVVMVEHVMHAIRSLCQHVVVLSAGRVIASGTPEDTLSHPDVIRVYLGDEQ
jgi:branched-chain amino acid transport system ATP-binding protein